MSEEPTKADALDPVIGFLSRYKDAASAASLAIPGGRCPELDQARGEQFCEGGRHHKVEQVEGGAKPYERRTAGRRCPALVRAEQRERLQPEVERLRPLLDRFGFARITPHDRRPVSKILRQGFDPHRAIDGLSDLVRLVDRYMVRRPDRNLLLTALPGGRGNKGVGKTHVQVLLHFAWLELGVNSVFTTSARLRSLAKRRLSGTEEQMAGAEREVQTLMRADVIVWSDIGDGDPLDPAKGLLTLTQDIAEESGAVFVLSMNHTKASLMKHPDVMERAVDRFWGDYRGNSAIEIELGGPSQRAHSLDVNDQERRDTRSRAAGDRA